MTIGAILTIVYHDYIYNVTKIGNAYSVIPVREPSESPYSYASISSTLGAGIGNTPMHDPKGEALEGFVRRVIGAAQGKDTLDFSNNAILNTSPADTLHIYDIATQGTSTPNIILGKNTEFFARDWSGAITTKENAIVRNEFSSNNPLLSGGSTIVINAEKNTNGNNPNKVENLYSSDDQYVIQVPKAGTNGIINLGLIEITDYGGNDTLILQPAPGANNFLTSADFTFN
jgi:hypothetical protein